MFSSRSKITSLISAGFIATFCLYYFYFQSFVAPAAGVFNFRKLLWSDVDSGTPTVVKNGSDFGATFQRNVTSKLGDDDNDDVECREIRNKKKSEKCAFAKATDDCQIDAGFVDYTVFSYCSFDPNLLPIPLIILFVWLVYLFIGIAVTADDFFCPVLTVIAETLHLSHNLAGVTFLAFGNGAPDIFSAIAAIGSAKNGDAGLAIGELFGAGIFVTTVVAGTISILCPFDAMQRPFLRDVVFYIAATFWAFCILWKKEITKIEAIGFILMYIAYVVVVLVGRYIYQKQKRSQLLSETIINPPGKIQSPDGTGVEDDENEVIVDRLTERQPLLQSGHDSSLQRRDSADVLHIERTPLQEFLTAINPIDTESWAEKHIIKKIFEVLKSPFVFVLIITVPVTDFKKDKHNWNRHLNTLHCITAPMFGILATVELQTFGGVFPVWALILIIGVILAVIVYITSENDRQPIYHAAFAYLGFVVAVIWIYSIANEIVNVLQTFGIVFNISSAILGLTLLAWGNSMGDLIPDLAMARQGYPRMGVSACFGGTLFNVLLGLGIPFTIQTVKTGGAYKLQLSLQEVVIVAFLLVSLVTSLIVVPLSRFRMARPYGILLIVLYVVFIVVVVLTETGAIHSDMFK